jgi:hypothetical protein
VADRKEPSQLIGDFLREAAVLVAILWPLEDSVATRRISGSVVVLALTMAGILLFWGIILEGRDGL